MRERMRRLKLKRKRKLEKGKKALQNKVAEANEPYIWSSFR
jgi:hypothetical protein